MCASGIALKFFCMLNRQAEKSTAGETRERNLNRHAEGLKRNPIILGNLKLVKTFSPCTLYFYFHRRILPISVGQAMNYFPFHVMWVVGLEV
jgi:hypothetical protein